MCMAIYYQGQQYAMIGLSDSSGEIPDDLNKTEYSEIRHDHSNGQGVEEADGVTSQEQPDEGIISHDKICMCVYMSAHH